MQFMTTLLEQVRTNLLCSRKVEKAKEYLLIKMQLNLFCTLSPHISFVHFRFQGFYFQNAFVNVCVKLMLVFYYSVIYRFTADRIEAPPPQTTNSYFRGFVLTSFKAVMYSRVCPFNNNNE